jgi:F-type H+-transporting ATPase subunit c
MYHPLAFVIAMSNIAAAIALLNGILTTLGQGSVAAHAIDAIARQPEAKGSITTTMFIGCGFAETSGVYGLLVAFLLIFVNPFVTRYADALIEAGNVVASIVQLLG